MCNGVPKLAMSKENFLIISFCMFFSKEGKHREKSDFTQKSIVAIAIIS